jgi:hypothetical protein
MKRFINYISKGDRPFWIVFTIAWAILVIKTYHSLYLNR